MKCSAPKQWRQDQPKTKRARVRNRRNLTRWSIDRIIMAFAGTMILLSLALGAVVQSVVAPAHASFVGVNLLQAAFTGLCPLAMALKRFGAKSGAAF